MDPPRAKNDQDGQGHLRGVPTNPDPWICPVTAITDWLEQLTHLHRRPSNPKTRLPRPQPTRHLHHPPDPRRHQRRHQDHRRTGRAHRRLRLPQPPSRFATDALDDGIPREQVQTYGSWRNHKSLDSYYRRTHIWGTTNPANRLSRLDG